MGRRQEEIDREGRGGQRGRKIRSRRRRRRRKGKGEENEGGPERESWGF